MLQDHVDKMIDLGIAFESFFLGDNNREVTFRFSLRGALYLEQEIEARRRLIGELRDIYKYRSIAVHEGRLPDKEKVNGENVPMRQFIERSQDLLKRCLLKVIRVVNCLIGALLSWAEGKGRKGGEIPRFGFAALGMHVSGDGDGSPHSRGQRRGGRPRGTPLRRCRRGKEESVIGSEIPRLGFAAFGMTCGGTGDGLPARREQRKGGRPRGTPYGLLTTRVSTA